METPVTEQPLARPSPAPSPAASPTLQADREGTVDVIRGFALLGILVMNIIAFAYPASSYESPKAAGSEPFIGALEGANATIWWIAHLFADLKMMALFSMLFGGGLILMTKSKPGGFAGLYYRRIGFLAIVGFLHGFVIWFGDILLVYALTGALLYPVRNFKPRTLMLIGIAVLVLGMLIAVGMGQLLASIPEKQRAGMSPTPEQYAQQVEQVRSGLSGSLIYNALMAIQAQIFGFFLWTSWRALGLMLIGMALMKLGFFTGKRSTALYLATTILGYGIGLAFIIPAARHAEAEGFPPMHMFSLGGQANYIGSIAIALGHASTLILLVRSGLLGFVASALSAVGRMAFTNYLATSLVMTFCFYGWGLGYFGKFQRAEVYWFVLGMWLLMLIWSPIWLSVFRTGPLEWLWRSATHLKWQPLTR